MKKFLRFGIAGVIALSAVALYCEKEPSSEEMTCIGKTGAQATCSTACNTTCSREGETNCTPCEVPSAVSQKEEACSEATCTEANRTQADASCPTVCKPACICEG